MSRLDDLAKQSPAATAPASKLWDEKPLSDTGARSALSKITFGELYIFFWKAMLAWAAVVAPFWIIYKIFA
jgi:hypothetical protein